VVLATLVGSSATVGAAERPHPRVTHDPEVSGSPYVGETLTAINAQYTGASQVSYRWYRCANPDSSDNCSVAGDGVSYTVVDADLGAQLTVVLFACDGEGNCDYGISSPTPAVTRKPAPTPTPTPTPPAAGPPAAPGPGTIAPDTSGGVRGENATLRWLAPFPIVRIKGFLAPAGALVTMLTVRAPRGSTITVRCRGRDCPRKQYARATMLVHLRPYERLLRGAMRLEISVTRRGFVGKRTVINLRRSKPPTRRDLCLYPGVRRAKSCKAA
jgi:hypothetical protein